MANIPVCASEYLNKVFFLKKIKNIWPLITFSQSLFYFIIIIKYVRTNSECVCAMILSLRAKQQQQQLTLVTNGGDVIISRNTEKYHFINKDPQIVQLEYVE